MVRYNISTPFRQAHFMAQVLHESGMLRYTQELMTAVPMRAEGPRKHGRPATGRNSKGEGSSRSPAGRHTRRMENPAEWI